MSGVSRASVLSSTGKSPDWRGRAAHASSGRTAMPLQNRVTPFGEIVAISQRGMFTGNRGIIHDPSTKTLLNRRWTTKAWLVCTCEYKGRRRVVMAGRSWTELFFLDEAVALAAGHRPCFHCRREAAEQFREFWTAAKGGPRPRGRDRHCLASRADRARPQTRHPIPGPLAALPTAQWSWSPDRHSPSAPGKPIDGRTRATRRRNGSRTRMDC